VLQVAKRKDPKILEHFVRERVRAEINSNPRGHRQIISKETGIPDSQLTVWYKERGLPGMDSIRALANYWNTTVVELHEAAERDHNERQQEFVKWRHPELLEALETTATVRTTLDELHRIDRVLPPRRLSLEDAREIVLNVDREERAKLEGSGIQESLESRRKRRGKPRKSEEA